MGTGVGVGVGAEDGGSGRDSGDMLVDGEIAGGR